MANSVASLRPIQTVAGVQPSTDETPWATKHYTDTLGIRFRGGKPEKIGGNQALSFDNGNTIDGVPRSIFSQNINGKNYRLIGTHTRLYALIGSGLVNITPFKLTSVSLGANLTTDYVTLGSNPAATVSGERTVTITKTGASRYRAGDEVTLSGFSGALNGIPDTELNAAHIVRSVSSGSFTIRTATAATSTGSGGGASVICASGLVQATKATHGLSDGDRVKISGAVAVGGITAPQLNLEFIIRVTGSGTFDFFTSGTASSSATGSGGSTVYYEPIDEGEINVSAGQGYGAGRYGVGLYGVSKTSTGGTYTYPQIWCFGRYGNLILCSPGNGGLLYEWDGDTNEAPVKVANSPDAINWFFVSDNIIVTFGADTGGGQIENRIYTCDQSDRTNWTATAENQVFDDAIEGAGRFISQINVRGVNLLFTFTQVYTFEYIGLPNVWRIREISRQSGIVGPLARIEVNGIAYWMGQQNLYTWRGAAVEVFGSNSSRRQTNQRFVFGQLSTLQRYKAFAWYNEPYEEINFHYPSQATGEVDLVSRVNLLEMAWANDEIERTAAEQPAPIAYYPILAAYDGAVYRHEFGFDNNGDGQPFSFTTNRFSLGKKETKLTSFIPDGVFSGSVTVTIRGYQWPQSLTPIDTQTFTVTATSGRQAVNVNGRYWTYTIAGDSLGQSFSLGDWMEELQQSGDGA